MDIMLNGERRTVPDGITVSGLLDLLKIQQQRVAVELNREIVKKGLYDTSTIKEGDSLEVVSFMQGGGGGEFGVRSSECGVKSTETIKEWFLYDRR